MSSISGNALRIFCIGWNYARHVRELSNNIPQAPVIFMKPAICLVPAGEAIHFPKHGHELHHEAEVVIQIGKEGRASTDEEARSFISGLTLGLDLTMRDVQRELKKNNQPWEAAKAFEQSAPMGEIVPYTPAIDLGNLTFMCKVNGIERQQGTTADMIFTIPRLIVEVGRIWLLRPGDLIFTGTPEGVGPLQIGDSVEVSGELFGKFAWKIVE